MSDEFRDDLGRLAKAGQPMHVQGEFAGVLSCPVCGATLVLVKEKDGTLRIPEHDSCGAGGGRLVPTSGHMAGSYTLIGPEDRLSTTVEDGRRDPV